MKKQIISLILFMSIHPALHAQGSVSYGYDSAGNRTSRVIHLSQMSPPAPPETQEEEEDPLEYSEMLSDIQLNIYPNPTAGRLKVELLNLPDEQTVDIKVYNLSGQLIVAREKAGWQTEIDLSGQPAGTYLMKIEAGEYRTEWRVIKS